MRETPEIYRAGVYMDEMLNPATRRGIQAGTLVPSIATSVERLAALGNTLESLQQSGLTTNYSLPPLGVRHPRRSQSTPFKPQVVK